MRLDVYILLDVAHFLKIEQRTLQKASGLGINTMSLWKVWKRHPTPESFKKAQNALVDLAGLPVEYKDMHIEQIARILIK
jgi:hypothetical protein